MLSALLWDRKVGMSGKEIWRTQIVNDGITVAKEIELEDPGKHRRSTNSGSGVQNQRCGWDGTTTATVLAQAMIREGLKNVAAGANPVSRGD